MWSPTHTQNQRWRAENLLAQGVWAQPLSKSVANPKKSNLKKKKKRQLGEETRTKQKPKQGQQPHTAEETDCRDYRKVSCCCSLAKSVQLCGDPTDCSLPGSSVLGISQERILEWVAISSSRGSSQPPLRHWQTYFTTEPPGKPTHHL